MAENQNELNEVMDLDTFKSFYRTSSVDKERFWDSDETTGGIKSMPLRDSAVYNGGFISQYLNRTGQAFAGVFAPIPGGVVALEGSQIQKRGLAGSIVQKAKYAATLTNPALNYMLDLTGLDDRAERFIGERLDGSYEAHLERSELMGEKLVNYGLYMTDVAKGIIQEMEAQQPTTNPAAKFLGDATGSILATVGLFYAGGPALPIAVFGASSGLDVSTEALRQGRDPDTALAAGLLVGGAVSGLEAIGLNSIFGKTAKSGIGAAARHILAATATEGLTEGLQTVVELGGAYAVGDPEVRSMTILDMVSQIAYASAVGAFAGGTMVSGVTTAQRWKAVNLMEEGLGVDHATADQLVKEAEQAAMDEVFSQVGEDTGYDTIQNRKIQNMRDIIRLARGEVGVENEAAMRILDSLNIASPGEQLLSAIRAEAVADVNAEIEEGTVRGVPVRGAKTVAKASEIVEDLEGRSAAEAEEFVPIGPEVLNEVEPIYREAFKGRVRELTRIAKDAKRELLLALKAGAKAGSTKIQNLVNSYLESTSELAYLKENPGDIVFTGDNKIQLSNAEVLGRIADRQTALILRNVKRNFKLGRRATRAEMEYVKAALKSLLARPGISRNQKYQELGKWLNRLKTPEQLQKRFAEIEMKVNDIVKDNLISVYKNSIDNMKKIMKGKGRGAKRQVKLPAQAQKLADIFLKALNETDINPAETAAKLGTDEGVMRHLAAQLATETNASGAELSPRDYMNIESRLRNFIETTSLEASKNRAVKKKTIERQRERVIKDLDKTKGLATTPARQAWENILSYISRRFNYDALVASLAKGMGTEIGSSAFEAIMDFSKSFVKNETLYTYFNTKFQDGAKRIFGAKSTLELNKKLLHDNLDLNDVIITKEKTDGTIESFWNGTLAQAREKYMLWLSPEGQMIMKDQGWTEETIESLVDNMSEEDMNFISLQLDIYNELYDPINETFRKTKGYDLGFRERYSPIYRTGLDYQNTNMIDQLLGRAPVSSEMQDPRFTKELTRSEKALKNVADFQKMSFYIKDASYYAAMAEQVGDVQSVLNNEVAEKIKEVRDEDFFYRLKRYIDIMAQGKRYGGGNLNSSLNKMVTNMQQMLLAGKAVLFPKQLVSSLAALEVVPPGDYAKYMSDLGKALKDGRLGGLLEHPYFAYRAMRRAISRDLMDITQAFEARQASNPKHLTEFKTKKAEMDITLNHYLYLGTQLGDMGGVVLNGWAVYNHYLKEGMSKAEAANAAVKHIDRTQQSARVTQQIGMSLDPNPVSRAFTSFTHAPMQYASILIQQLDTIGTDRFNAKQFAKTYAVFFTVLPILYSAIGRAFQYKKEDTPQYLSEFALGPFDDVPITGGLLRVLASRAIYNVMKNQMEMEDVNIPYSARWDTAGTGLLSSMFKNLADVERALSKEYEDGLTLADFLHITTQLAEATGPIGGVYSGLGRTISGGAEGIALMSEENSEGTTVNSVRRLLMLLGYSEYATRPREEE